MTRASERRRATGTRALLDIFAAGDPEEVVRLGKVFSGLGRRSFGMLLFVSTLPAFIPIPGIAGAISGPLVVLIGLQLLIGLRRPWLPGFIAGRGPRRELLVRFRDRVGPWLGKLERWVRPRAPALLDHRAASAFSGLQIVLVGLLLSLPIPFTNFLFAGLLLLYAMALLERDGRLMAVAWVAGTGTIVVAGVLSGRLARLAVESIDLLM